MLNSTSDIYNYLNDNLTELVNFEEEQIEFKETKTLLYNDSKLHDKLRTYDFYIPTHIIINEPTESFKLKHITQYIGGQDCGTIIGDFIEYEQSDEKIIYTIPFNISKNLIVFAKALQYHNITYKKENNSFYKSIELTFDCYDINTDFIFEKHELKINTIIHKTNNLLLSNDNLFIDTINVGYIENHGKFYFYIDDINELVDITIKYNNETLTINNNELELYNGNTFIITLIENDNKKNELVFRYNTQVSTYYYLSYDNVIRYFGGLCGIGYMFINNNIIKSIIDKEFICNFNINIKTNEDFIGVSYDVSDTGIILDDIKTIIFENISNYLNEINIPINAQIKNNINKLIEEQFYYNTKSRKTEINELKDNINNIIQPNKLDNLQFYSNINFDIVDNEVNIQSDNKFDISILKKIIISNPSENFNIESLYLLINKKVFYIIDFEIEKFNNNNGSVRKYTNNINGDITIILTDKTNNILFNTFLNNKEIKYYINYNGECDKIQLNFNCYKTNTTFKYTENINYEYNFLNCTNEFINCSKTKIFLFEYNSNDTIFMKFDNIDYIKKINNINKENYEIIDNIVKIPSNTIDNNQIDITSNKTNNNCKIIHPINHTFNFNPTI